MNKLYKYLPFGINCQDETSKYVLTPALLAMIESSEIEVLPILRELSKENLTNKIYEINGEKIIPSHELSEFTCLYIMGMYDDFKQNYSHMIPESQLDFLRSLHFNVDFDEGQYIKLID